MDCGRERSVEPGRSADEVVGRGEKLAAIPQTNEICRRDKG